MKNKTPLPTDASIITTYRCPMRCKMCNIWKYPTEESKEINADDLSKLPKLKFVNITGGEPFIRDDIEEIVNVLSRKSKRIVISTSGYLVDRIIKLAEKYTKIGIRVSIEGLSKVNDELRGHDDGFDKGLKTLLALKKMGLRDIGFGITVSDANTDDMLWLYELGKSMNMEFATAAFHNSFYFHKYDNQLKHKEKINSNFKELINRLLKESNPKSWFRAFFNLGLINYVNGGKRMLTCEAGTVNFFIDPYGEIFPCNGMEEKYWMESMGNIKTVNKFEDIWFSKKADEVRALVRKCPKNCWMIGAASPVMHKYFFKILPWIISNKFKSFFNVPVNFEDIPFYDVGQDPCQGDLREKI